MSDKVKELNRHAPSVDSVIERLDRNRKKIKSITAVIVWEDGSCDITHDTKSLPDLSYDSVLLNAYIQDLVFDQE